jgi:hypothetical protein
MDGGGARRIRPAAYDDITHEPPTPLPPSQPRPCILTNGYHQGSRRTDQHGRTTSPLQSRVLEVRGVSVESVS